MATTARARWRILRVVPCALSVFAGGVAAQATQASGSRSAGDGLVPPGPVPVAEWTFMSWVGVALYVGLFFVAAWWIYRLADLEHPSNGPGTQGPS